MRLFLLGLLIGLFILAPLAAYAYVRLGFLSLATTAKPFPFEQLMAHTALNESVGSAANDKDPLSVSDENLMAGAKAYRERCAVCHGLTGQPKTSIAAGMFPKPPQLLEGHGVTDDPEGATHWKIVNGIRLSGMPGFSQTLSDTERWQITMLLKHADNLPVAVKAVLSQPQGPPQ